MGEIHPMHAYFLTAKFGALVQLQFKKYFVVSNLNLSTQIALGFCLIVLFFIAVNVSNIWVNKDLVSSLRKIDAEVSPIVKTSKKISAELNDAEVLTLNLLVSVNETQFDAHLAELESNLAGLEAHLKALQQVSLSGEIANKFASNIELLEANHKPRLIIYQEINETQLNIVESSANANHVSDKLAIQEQALRPLIDDIYYMIDDDFLITSLYELTASLNFGLFKIEKINNVTSQAELDALTAEFNVWLGEYGGILSNIGFASNDEVFTGFLLILCVAMVSIYLTRRFRQSIGQLMCDLDFLAEGRIRTKTSTTKNDEFSLVSNSLATVVGNLKKIISDINQSASQVHKALKNKPRPLAA